MPSKQTSILKVQHR